MLVINQNRDTIIETKEIYKNENCIWCEEDLLPLAIYFDFEVFEEKQFPQPPLIIVIKAEELVDLAMEIVFKNANDIIEMPTQKEAVNMWLEKTNHPYRKYVFKNYKVEEE